MEGLHYSREQYAKLSDPEKIKWHFCWSPNASRQNITSYHIGNFLTDHRQCLLRYFASGRKECLEIAAKDGAIDGFNPYDYGQKWKKVFAQAFTQEGVTPRFEVQDDSNWEFEFRRYLRDKNVEDHPYKNMGVVRQGLKGSLPPYEKGVHLHPARSNSAQGDELDVTGDRDDTVTEPGAEKANGGSSSPKPGAPGTREDIGKLPSKPVKIHQLPSRGLKNSKNVEFDMSNIEQDGEEELKSRKRLLRLLEVKLETEAKAKAQEEYQRFVEKATADGTLERSLHELEEAVGAEEANAESDVKENSGKKIAENQDGLGGRYVNAEPGPMDGEIQKANRVAAQFGLPSIPPIPEWAKRDSTKSKSGSSEDTRAPKPVFQDHVKEYGGRRGLPELPKMPAYDVRERTPEKNGWDPQQGERERPGARTYAAPELSSFHSTPKMTMTERMLYEQMQMLSAQFESLKGTPVAPAKPITVERAGNVFYRIDPQTRETTNEIVEEIDLREKLFMDDHLTDLYLYVEELNTVSSAKFKDKSLQKKTETLDKKSVKEWNSKT